jgi:hypothetical protein
MSPVILPQHPWISLIEFPLYKMAFPNAGNDADLAAMNEDVLRISKAMDSPYAWVVDMSKVATCTAYQRKLVADNDIALREYERKNLVCSAIVADSTLTRGLLTAVFWLAPPIYPYKIFATAGEAEIWARQQLKERGVVMGAKVDHPASTA